MSAHAYVSRIMAGKETALSALEKELATNRSEERYDQRQRLGISREVAYLQELPGSPSLHIVYREGDHVDRAFETLISSNHPFDQWLLGQLSEIQGVPRHLLSPPAARLILDMWTLGRTNDVYLFAVPIAPGLLDRWLSGRVSG